MLKSCFFILSSLCLLGLGHHALALDAASFDVSFTHTTELKPMPPSFQLAKSIFLPDRFDDLGLSDYDTIEGDYNAEDCADFTLSSCPAHGVCAACATDKSLLKLISCDTGYKLSGGVCRAFSCSALGYVASVPYGQICTAVTVDALDCYQACRNVDCAGYTLDCNSLPENALAVEKCPECAGDNANCGENLCKISQCAEGYKIAENGTTCLALDDTCPDGYFKECESGTQGEPVLTEAGNKCYQCKPKVLNCPTGQLNLDTYWCDGALRCLLPQVN